MCQSCKPNLPLSPQGPLPYRFIHVQQNNVPLIKRNSTNFYPHSKYEKKSTINTGDE